MKHPTLHHLKKIIWPVLMILVMVYLVYHFLQGHYGLLSWQKLKKSHKEVSIKTEQLKEKTEALQDKVDRLKPGYLDLDYVEELVQEKLGVYHPNDLIIHENTKGGQ